MSNYIYLILRTDKNRHPSIFIAISEILPYIAGEMECAFITSLKKGMLSYDVIIQVTSYLIIVLGPINRPYHRWTRT